MALTDLEQIIHLIKEASNILLIAHARPDGDTIGSTCALAQALEKINKQVTALCADKVPDHLQFLPWINNIKQAEELSSDCIINIKCAEENLKKLKYNTVDGFINIVVSPKTGSFTEEDISIHVGGSAFDLIITLDAADLKQLGGIYTDHTTLFYDTPLINIDHHISNDYFGKINLVDITATSTAEIVLSIIEKLDDQMMLLDSHTATCILAGIITDTGSFQNLNTSPRAFTLSAHLISYGARHQEIIKHVYKTHKLEKLKLWGMMLSQAKPNNSHDFIYTTVSQKDFQECHATREDLEGFNDHLLSATKNVQFSLVVSEQADGLVSGSLRSCYKNIDVEILARQLGGGGHKQAAGFKLHNTSLRDALPKILTSIEKTFSSGNKKPLVIPTNIQKTPKPTTGEL